MLVDLLDPEPERCHGEKAGVGVSVKFSQVKQHLMFTGLHADTTRDRMIELTVRADPTFGDPGARRFKPPYLDLQALRGPPACDIHRVNRYSASHFVSHSSYVNA